MSRFINRKSIAATFIALALIASVAAGFVFHSGSTRQTHAAGAAPSAVKGVGTFKGTVDLKSVKVSKPTGPIKKYNGPFKVNRTLNNASANSNALSKSTNVPAVTPFSVSGVGTLLRSFNGISSADSASANGFDVEPPDQGLCVGAGTVIELVNLAAAGYDTHGNIIFGVPLFIVFNESPNEFLSDPRCFFDKTTSTFFLTVLAIDPTGTTSHIDVAVLNLNLGLAVYQFDTTDAVNPNCSGGCFADQPYLGIDKYNLYIGGNEFGINTAYFGGALLFAISKSQLVSLAASPNFAEFLHISDAGGPIETLQPAITYDANAPAEYLLHAFTVDPSGNNNSFDHRLGVFALTNQAAVTAGGLPTLSNPTIINSEFYAQPNVALNPNSNVLNADDDRMQQVEYINGNLMGALDTAVSIKGDPVNRDGAAWFDIEPSLSSSHTVKAHVKAQGYIAAAGLYVLYPAIMQSKDGTVEMAFSISSSTINPSAAYAVVPDGKHGKNAGQIFVAASGTGPDTGFTCGGPLIPCRWGDYSAAVLDPSSTNIWMATEYIPPVGSQSVFANWGTAVYEVKA